MIEAYISSGRLPARPSVFNAAGRELRKNLNRLARDLEGREFDKMVRSVMRQHHPQIRSIFKRKIKNKGLVDTGLMHRFGVRTLVPRGQKPNHPWVVTYVNRRWGFQSGFLEEGTVDRYTKKGYYRGKIHQRRHKKLMEQTLRITDRTIKPKVTATLEKNIEAIITRNGF